MTEPSPPPPSLRRSVASSPCLCVAPTEFVIRHSSFCIPAPARTDAVLRALRASAVKPRTARKKTSAPKPFASPTATAALAPMRFTPRHDSESRINMRKALLSNGFGATQGPTEFRQSSPTRYRYRNQPVAVLCVLRASAVKLRTARKKNSAPNPIRSATATPGAIANKDEPVARPQDRRSSFTVNRLWGSSETQEMPRADPQPH